MGAFSEGLQGRTYFLFTYGCQMNEFDSEVIAAAMERLGCHPAADPVGADLVLFNTCCVREKADLKVYGRLGQVTAWKRDNPRLLAVVLGCLAQKDGEELRRRFPQVDLVVGTFQLDGLEELVKEAWESRIPAVRVEQKERSLELSARRRSRIKAWVPVSVGCDCACTYCIVPRVRGNMRSRPPEAVAAQVEDLARQGFLEFTLLGQNVNAYGHDLPGRPGFARLLRALNEISAVRRIRFTSPHPRDFDAQLVAAIRDLPAVCQQVHLPVQSGDDVVLRRMGRGYTSADYLALVESLRRQIPGIALSTDFIVGFPGESRAQFEHTLDLVRQVRFDHAFMFAYSPRQGTAALRLPEQVPAEEGRQRLLELIQVQNAITRECHQALEGRTLEVLVEGVSRKDPGRLTGRTRGNQLVHFCAPASLVGSLVQVKVVKGFTWGVLAEPEGAAA